MTVQCELCPKACVIGPGKSGDCRVRINLDGVLRTVVYSYPCTMHVDPIEKKPLFHFLPSTAAFSLATVGCNLHCKNCQNWEISQSNPEDTPAFFCPPETVVELTKNNQCTSIAYTYSEPIIYYEYTLDTSKLARQAGIKNVLVSAGYINQEPWKKLLQYTDAATIDIKGITEEFYRDVCSATLKPVQDALVTAKASGIHLEVSNLVIPTLNDKPDDIRKLVIWIRDNLGSETPLHFLRFFPMHQMTRLAPTSPETLNLAREISTAEGMKFVYIGNVTSKEGQNTYCPKCKKLLIERSGYVIVQNRIKAGSCPDCSEKIYGVWK